MYHCTIFEAFMLIAPLINKGYPLWDAMFVPFLLRRMHNELVQASYIPENIRAVLEDI